VRTGDADREDARDDRRVEGALSARVGAAALGVRHHAEALGFPLVQIGALGQDAHGAAHRAFAEQRALRPAQDLDAVEVPGAHIGADWHGDARERQVIEIEAVLVSAERSGNAADRDLGAQSRAAIVDADARGFLQEVGEIGGPALLEGGAAHRSDCDRQVDSTLLALARGDDDVAVASGIRSGGALLLRSDRRAHESRAQQRCVAYQTDGHMH
jgi:hypothetical protein